LFPLHPTQHYDASSRNNVQCTLFQSPDVVEIGHGYGLDVDAQQHAPLHLVEKQIAPPGTKEGPKSGTVDQSTEGLGIIFIASFFGIELPANNKKEKESVFSDETKKAEHTTLTEARKSATIKVVNSNNNNTSAPRESEQKYSKMLPSATQRSSVSSSKPAD
jgi:hypothetical protein